jgi:O-antigen/teichoic acid export membrane protein
MRRNTALALLAQLATGVFTTILTLYLARALGPDAYGVFALALGVGAIAGLIADAGIVESSSRFVAESRGDPVAVAALLRDAFRLKVATALILPGALFALAGPISGAFDQPDLTWPIRGIAVSLFANSIFTLYIGTFIALGRLGVNLRLIFLESLAETVGSIALVAAGAGATGAAFGRAIGYFVGALIAGAVVIRLFGRTSLRLVGRGGGRAKEIARYAFPLLITDSAYTLYAQVDVLIIGSLLSTKGVGVFSAPLRLAAPLGYVGRAFTNTVAPRQVKSRREPGSVQAFQTGLRWLILYQAALLAPLVVWAEPIVRLLYGEEFRESTNVLRVLAFYIFLGGPSILISTTVNYLGRAVWRIPIVLFCLLVNVALDLSLIPAIGVLGAAIGTGVAYGLYVPAHLWICHRELRFELRKLAVTVLRALTAAALMGCVLYAVGTHSLSAGAWVGILTFCLALALTREVTWTEIQGARRFGIAAVERVAPVFARK